MARSILILAATLALGACAHVPSVRDPRAVLDDERFPSPTEDVRTEAVFTLTPAMRAYLDGALAERVRAKGARRGLLAAVRDDLRLEYDAARTRTAGETFDARTGNCLSLVIMTASFARALGVEVRYQMVYGVDTWSRSGDLAVHSGHVNLVLGPRASERVGTVQEPPLVVDFMPPERVARLGVREVPEDMILAMYLNNRAAESLAAGAVEPAYWWARAAVLAFPSYVSAYNTLGIVYLRHGDLAQAERALRQALALEPLRIEPLSNLAIVLARLGREPEAQTLRERIATLRPVAPFQHLLEGIAAMEQGDYEQARRSLQLELAQRPYGDDAHFALALVQLRLGDARRARQHLELALAHSTTRSSHDLYAAKLQHLQRTAH